jgi:hypothetical protein
VPGSLVRLLESVRSTAMKLLGGVLLCLALSGCGGTRTVTVAGPTHTVTQVVVHTHTVTVTRVVHAPAVTSTATAPSSPPTATTDDCNDLPPGASTNLNEVRESRCEVEKLNAESPSTADEHEIESMISSERAIEASE